jgi:ABC-2 type transport system ATP-binding protein
MATNDPIVPSSGASSGNTSPGNTSSGNTSSGGSPAGAKTGAEDDRTVVSVRSLTKNFGRVRALDNISLEVSEGEIFGFIGPDGAGKTTLFRILVTLLVPDRGTARVLGFDPVGDYRELRRRVGYMPGRFSLYPDLTVEENLNFFAAVFSTTVDQNEHQIRDIYHQIAPFRNRRAADLSGGMKQKLALSCALIHKPEILFLDEPTTGVDAVSRRELWEMLGKLRADGLTIVVSTPYMDEATRCDRIALLNHGSILAVDTPGNISDSFGCDLYAVRAEQRYGLLKLLRAHPDARSVHTFGDRVHYTDRRGRIDREVLRTWLEKRGLTGVRIEEIRPGVEDMLLELLSRSSSGPEPHPPETN